MWQKGEVAAIPKAGWEGSGGPTVCHCESWWFLFFLFLLRQGLETLIGEWQLLPASWEPHAGSEKQSLLFPDFLG